MSDFINQMNGFIFGQPVHFTKYLVRREACKKREFYRTWLERDWESTGLYLGTRTLQNGRIHYDEDGTYFTADEYFKAALICPSPNRNPIYVPLPCLSFEPTVLASALRVAHECTKTAAIDVTPVLNAAAGGTFR